MIGNRNTQTAFRFREELLEKAKLKARRQKKSLNSYVEELIENDLGSEDDKYARINEEIRALKKQSAQHPGLDAFVGCAKGLSFSRKELVEDPKLEALVEKHEINIQD